MLGDTAVAVHPDDPRYQHLIGKMVELPLTGRRIPIIADAILVDPAFGTGCVKVTPAHDPNDYQTGLRNGLPMINLLNPDGTYNENAGEKYAGLDRMVVRKRVVEDLKAADLLERVDSYLVRLNHSDRSKTPIEPYLSDQWFVRMGDDPDGAPGFAQQAMDAVAAGKVRIHPRALRQELRRLAGREARLVHQPAALVGPPHSHLVLLDLRRGRSETGLRRPFRRLLARGRDRRLADLRRTRPGRRRPRRGPHARGKRPTSSTPGSARPSGRTRPWAGPTTRPSYASTTRPASCPRPATSSPCGSPAW